jgi:hypothetical protein
MLGAVDLAAIDLSIPQLLQVTTSRSAVVTFATENLDLQLKRWRLVHDYASQTGRAVVSLDLSVSNNVPARWVEAASLPLPAPRPKTKPSPYRKRHV